LIDYLNNISSLKKKFQLKQYYVFAKEEKKNIIHVPILFLKSSTNTSPCKYYTLNLLGSM